MKVKTLTFYKYFLNLFKPTFKRKTISSLLKFMQSQLFQSVNVSSKCFINKSVRSIYKQSLK